MLKAVRFRKLCNHTCTNVNEETKYASETSLAPRLFTTRRWEKHQLMTRVYHCLIPDNRTEEETNGTHL